MRRTPKLGQHFLKAGWAAAKLAHAVSLRPGEIFVEIGPGKGILTHELLALGPVTAIEKDELLVGVLKQTFADEIASGKLTLINGDVRDFVPPSQPYVVAANIPYYITGEIVRQFLTTAMQPRAMALLVQKEVAQRIMSKKESLLSLSVKVYGTPKIVEKVARGNFSPPPKVDSAILLIDRISKDFFSDISEEAFFKLLHAGFGQKRKMLLGNLSSLYDKENLRATFAECGIPEKVRAENLSVDRWKQLLRALQ